MSEYLLAQITTWCTVAGLLLAVWQEVKPRFLGRVISTPDAAKKNLWRALWSHKALIVAVFGLTFLAWLNFGRGPNPDPLSIEVSQMEPVAPGSQQWQKFYVRNNTNKDTACLPSIDNITKLGHSEYRWNHGRMLLKASDKGNGDPYSPQPIKPYSATKFDLVNAPISTDELGIASKRFFEMRQEGSIKGLEKGSYRFLIRLDCSGVPDQFFEIMLGYEGGADIVAISAAPHR